MEENTEKNEQDVNVDQQNTENTDQHEQEKVSQKPSADDLLAEEKDRYVRLYAEFENYKKRTQKEKSDYYLYASQDLMTSMLGILDDFERAIKEISKNGNAADLEGVELIYQKFKSKLTEKGLRPMDVNPGDTFDVDLHEAITQIPAPTEDLKGKIVDVVETGYTLHDKVIRFAKVVTGY